jgi:hypothetical protein
MNVWSAWLEKAVPMVFGHDAHSNRCSPGFRLLRSAQQVSIQADAISYSKARAKLPLAVCSEFTERNRPEQARRSQPGLGRDFLDVLISNPRNTTPVSAGTHTHRSSMERDSRRK